MFLLYNQLLKSKRISDTGLNPLWVLASY